MFLVLFIHLCSISVKLNIQKVVGAVQESGSQVRVVWTINEMIITYDLAQTPIPVQNKKLCTLQTFRTVQHPITNSIMYMSLQDASSSFHLSQLVVVVWVISLAKDLPFMKDGIWAPAKSMIVGAMSTFPEIPL